MSSGILARALANRSRGMEAYMPPSPTQGPAPRFLESYVPPAPQQGPDPVFFRSPAVSPEGLENQNPQMMPPHTVRATPMMRAAAQAPQQGIGMPQQPMPQPEAFGPQEPFGPQAPPMPRNELERDYYRQFAQNQQGFDTGWLGRMFG
jgi:hypothetical protein